MRLVLNNIFPRGGLPQERIEQALNKQVTVSFPYAPDILIQAINLGHPIIQEEPGEPLSILLEDFAFYLSQDQHKKTRPEKPTHAWKRVYDRFIQARNKREKAK